MNKKSKINSKLYLYTTMQSCLSFAPAILSSTTLRSEILSFNDMGQQHEIKALPPPTAASFSSPQQKRTVKKKNTREITEPTNLVMSLIPVVAEYDSLNLILYSHYVHLTYCAHMFIS